jgi:hypothetical protein
VYSKLDDGVGHDLAARTHRDFVAVGMVGFLSTTVPPGPPEAEIWVHSLVVLFQRCEVSAADAHRGFRLKAIALVDLISRP